MVLALIIVGVLQGTTRVDGGVGCLRLSVNVLRRTQACFWNVCSEMSNAKPRRDRRRLGRRFNWEMEQ